MTARDAIKTLRDAVALRVPEVHAFSTPDSTIDRTTIINLYMRDLDHIVAALDVILK
jgi:hypothetical protein